MKTLIAVLTLAATLSAAEFTTPYLQLGSAVGTTYQSYCECFGAFVNKPFKAKLNFAGGSGPYAYSVVGTAPPGISLSSDGILSGTPATAGTFTFIVTCSGLSKAYTMEVKP